MKKVLWAVLVMAVAAPTLFAQNQTRKVARLEKANLASKVGRVMQQVQAKDSLAAREVLEKLQKLIQDVGQMKSEDYTLIMQDIFWLGEDFRAFAVTTPGVEAWKLAQEINAPIRTGWDRDIFVKDKLVEALQYNYHDGVIDEDKLSKFHESLQLYLAMQNEQEAQEYVQMRQAMEGFRNGIKQMNATNATYPSNVSQALITLADKYFALYDVQQNPTLARLVASELNQPVTIAGQRKYLAQWAQQNNEWEVLETFAQVLEQASK
ncbi:MAG: hypothetical protein MJ053_02535 [Elusimicrobiaceae bacterium]|nr:hypothetical protein [Elusimicrobiaceae bacterium]